MTQRVSIAKRIARVLMRHVPRVLPPTRLDWAEAMRRELDHIESPWDALKWSTGCLVASYRARANEAPKSLASVLKKPTAFLPITMSLAALTVVLVTVTIFGVVHESDEGAAAHIWQLLMAGQMPLLLLFALKWLPRAPKQALVVLALQGGSVLAAIAPVYFLNL